MLKVTGGPQIILALTVLTRNGSARLRRSMSLNSISGDVLESTIPTTSYPWFLGSTDHDLHILNECMT